MRRAAGTACADPILCRVDEGGDLRHGHVQGKRDLGGDEHVLRAEVHGPQVNDLAEAGARERRANARHVLRRRGLPHQHATWSRVPSTIATTHEEHADRGRPRRIPAPIVGDEGQADAQEGEDRGR